MLLLRARETAMGYFRPTLAEHGVTEQQWRVLRALNESEQLTAAGLASRCAILAPSLSRILRALQDRGWIRVRRGADDQRELRVELAPAGQRLFDRIAPASEAQYLQIQRRMSPERLALLYTLLEEFIHTGDAPVGDPGKAPLAKRKNQ